MAKELATIYESENYTYAYDAINGRIEARRKDGTAGTYIFSDGSRQRWFGEKTTDTIKKEINEAFEVIKKIVKEKYQAKKAEMFPDFETLEYHEKNIAQIKVRQACGFATNAQASQEIAGWEAAHGKVQGEIERERFDNQ